MKRIGVFIILEEFMTFDFKKEFKEFYLPKNKPEVITVPQMNFLAVRGKGNPNQEGGEYEQALQLLYSIAYTLKMSYKSEYKIKGFFEYIVPPLEGFWWMDDCKGDYDYKNKDNFSWISIIRLPNFVMEKDFSWAIETAKKKKKQDFSKVEFLTYDEGLCVQCMHIGSYDDESTTIKAMEEYALEKGYLLDISKTRYHHEIYLKDPRKTDISKLRTVIRHPIKKGE